jgi:hypothetical protein
MKMDRFRKIAVSATNQRASDTATRAWDSRKTPKQTQSRNSCDCRRSCIRRGNERQYDQQKWRCAYRDEKSLDPLP